MIVQTGYNFKEFADKMAITGIIAEYNPFHNGHAFLIQELRKSGAGPIAVVLSGNFVQRGEAAILSKWARTKQTLLCGADLVVELPLPWAVAGAERFASGGVFLVAALGADRIGFGSECGDIGRLKQAANALASPLLHDAMRAALDSGSTFAAARQQAVGSLFGSETASLLSEPNNILGIEYLKALERLHASLRPFTIKRAGSGHNSRETAGGNASSAEIRALLKKGADVSAYLPADAFRVLKAETERGRAPADLAYLERGILAKLRRMSRQELSRVPDISEGLENRVEAAVQKARSLEELYRLVKSKRYPLARIRRILLSAFLEMDVSYCAGSPPYLRVLGIGKHGAEILRKAKAQSPVPILSRHAAARSLNRRAAKIWELENRAADLYALCMPQTAPCGFDRTNGVVVL
jgi:predicted nucleotidyltransferase